MRPLWLGLLILLCPRSLPAESPEVSCVELAGVAIQAEGGNDHLYTEQHTQFFRSGHLVAADVRYVDPRGKLIARKTLDYTPGLTRPNFRFDDLRTGFAEVAYWSGGEVVVRHRDSRGEAWSEDELEVPGAVVIDAGFDNAVRAHWDLLTRGQEVTVSMVVPRQEDYYTLSFRKAGVVQRGATRLLKLEMQLDSWILSLLTDSVTLYYDMSDRRLIEYVGISNVRDPNGEQQDARIVFGTRLPSDPQAPPRLGLSQLTD